MPTKKKPATRTDAPQRRIAELEIRLAEAEDTLRAIREGEVDAVVVTGSKGEQVFSLTGAESIYRLIVETMKEAAFTLSLDGRILYCNQQFSAFVRTPQEQIIGRRLDEFVPADQRHEVAFLLVKSQGEPVRQRLVFQGPGASAVPAHISATMLHQPDGLSICLVASDLSELENSTELIQQLRRQQEALQAANEELAATEEELRVQNEELSASRIDLDRTRARYQDLFEAAPDGYLVTDPEGTIQEVNQAAAHLLGRPASELKGNPFSSLVPAAGREGYLEILAALNGGTAAPKWEMEVRPLEGPQFWAAISAAASSDEEGRISGLRWLIRDITARRRAEVELQKAAEELGRSNSDLEAFAYVASHDLQEPLRTIGGFLKLLQERYADQLDDKAREFIAYSVDGATRMSSLIRDLLDYARVGSIERQLAAVDFAELVESARRNLRTAIEESHADIAADPLPILTADASLIRNVFQNLIGNAVKFRAEGRHPEVRIGARQEGGEWLFHVKDNGIGIDPTQADRLFNLFQRLHSREEYPGTGIGLAICKKIVERHGGRIWVESEQGKGATFWFSLPVDGK